MLDRQPPSNRPSQAADCLSRKLFFYEGFEEHHRIDRVGAEWREIGFFRLDLVEKFLMSASRSDRLIKSPASFTTLRIPSGFFEKLLHLIRSVGRQLLVIADHKPPMGKQKRRQ